MTEPETTDEDCSTIFTYDEIIALVKRKKSLWLKKLHQVDSDAPNDFHALSGYVAACNFIIQDIATKAIEKQRKRLAERSKMQELLDAFDECDARMFEEPEASRMAFWMRCADIVQRIKDGR